jgi:hypothetical protein
MTLLSDNFVKMRHFLDNDAFRQINCGLMPQSVGFKAFRHRRQRTLIRDICDII